jgi:hypothetical protein
VDGALSALSSFSLFKYDANHQGSFLPVHWYDANLPEITATTLSRLRVGHYDDADDNTKKLWMMICTKVMPNVARTYKTKEVQKTSLMLEVVPVPMEALVFWFLQVCYSDWVKHWNQPGESCENSGEVKKSTKPKGTNFATLHGDTFFAIWKDLTVRRTTTTAQTWDRAVLSELTKPRAGAKRFLEGGKAQASKRQAKLYPTWIVGPEVASL